MIGQKIELKRGWLEKVCCMLGVAVGTYLLGESIFEGASLLRVIWVAAITLFCAWGAYVSFTKPDVSITEGKLYLSGRIGTKPLVLSLSEVESVERRSGTPIWRVPPLLFHFKDHSKITFSTGGDEGRMRRIIAFIERETTLRIRYS